MDRNQFIAEIRKACFFLEEEGYLFNQLEKNIFYTKSSETEGYRIRFNWLEFGDIFQTYGLIAEKRFNKIEEEIQKVVDSNLIDYYTIQKNPAENHIPEELTFTSAEDTMRFGLSTTEDITLFGQFVKTFYDKSVLDFYGSYNSIEKVNGKLNGLLANRNIQSLFTTEGNTTIIRFYLVSYFSNNAEIGAFFDETYIIPPFCRTAFCQN